MDPASPKHIEATYRLRVSAREAPALARAIALEQTVELPGAMITDAAVREHIVGRVLEVEADGDGARATLAYEGALASGQLAQLVNLLFGNVSLYPGVRLVDVSLPPEVLGAFPGPRHGIAGVRRLTGVYDRPLLATALKPRGLPAEDLAALAGDFALGGGDLVKDDQNLVDDLETFKRRVDACLDAVEAANARTGRRCLYLPHLAGPAEELPRRVEFLVAAGAPGVLACPLLLGLDTVRGIAGAHDLIVMAHPALAGGFLADPEHGIAHGLLLGTLFRLAGADISIFPNAGGRFDFSVAQCAEIATCLREPLGALAPAWPCPAGGMSPERIPGMVHDFRADAVLLVGGALLGHPDGIRAGTRACADAIRAAAGERLAPPARRALTADAGPGSGVIAFREGFEWAGRESTPYKDAADRAFRAVRRVELVGRHGEHTNTDLRYFEVEPGGYTSLEKHVHTHVIVGARGTGVLILGNRRHPLAPMDVAWVEPAQVHQLLNESDAPFGFFCVVDHARDPPMSP